MSTARLDTGFNIELDFEICAFHKRILAWAIDLAVMMTYLYFSLRIVSAVLGSSWNRHDHTALVFFIGLPPSFYHLFCEVFFNGQSLGKMAMSVQVIAQTGGQPSLSQYLIRWIFRTIDFPVWILLALGNNALPWWSSIFLFLGLGCILATEYSQRVGDLVAGTILIDTKRRTSWEDTVFMEVEKGYQPRYPQVMQLSDKDINTLKSIISTTQAKNNRDLSMKVAERIRSKLSISSHEDSLEFLETLLKDYNYYSTN